MSEGPFFAFESDELGTMERRGDVCVLRFRRHLSHPREKVWRALTEETHLGAWFPTTVEGEWAAGASLHFSFRESEGEPFDGQMLSFDPPALMELRWADDVLRFELFAEGERSCLLSLTVTFPEPGKGARDAAGWHVCLERLAYECAGSTPPWPPTERWRAVHPRYVAGLGPAASTIGPPEVGEQARSSG